MTWTNISPWVDANPWAETDEVNLSGSYVAVANNVGPVVSLSTALAQAGQVVTITATDSDGTIASVAVTGVTPVPALAGTGGNRTFVAPILLSNTVLTVTATDNQGLASSKTVTIKAAVDKVFWNGGWKPCYKVVLP